MMVMVGLLAFTGSWPITFAPCLMRKEVVPAGNGANEINGAGSIADGGFVSTTYEIVPQDQVWDLSALAKHLGTLNTPILLL